jgi:putative membrane protein
MLSAATQNPLRWHPHPEVWLLIAVVIGLGLYVTRAIQPLMVAAGHKPITLRQKAFFWTGVVVLWAAADWPVHDLGENYLFSIHMIQHLVLSFIMPPLFLMATPTWLARLILQGRFGRTLTRLSRPIVAGFVFNLFVAGTHWSGIINLAVTNGPAHYILHLALVFLALLMWMPVCGPLPELRLVPLAQCAYLFLMSVLPTIPAAWLTLAEKPVYSVYDRPYHLWGVNVITDQQSAGLIMKLGGGAFLWTLIVVIFFKWAAAQEFGAKQERHVVSQDEVLTWNAVTSEFERLGPAPKEPAHPSAG